MKVLVLKLTEDQYFELKISTRTIRRVEEAQVQSLQAWQARREDNEWRSSLLLIKVMLTETLVLIL